MARALTTAAAAAAAAAAATGAALPGCAPRDQCTFLHTNEAGVQRGWDLSTLCLGGSEYRVRLGAAGDQYIAFNICGSTASMCSYDPSTPAYNARATAIQYVRGAANDQLQPTTLTPGATCSGAVGCYDWDNYPAMTDAGIPGAASKGCCTDPCEVISTSLVQWSVLNPDDPSVGVQLTFAPMGGTGDDPFACGPDPAFGYKLQLRRRLTVNLFCGATSTGQLADVNATEISVCDYLIQVGYAPVAHAQPRAHAVGALACMLAAAPSRCCALDRPQLTRALCPPVHACRAPPPPLAASWQWQPCRFKTHFFACGVHMPGRRPADRARSAGVSKLFFFFYACMLKMHAHAHAQAFLSRRPVNASFFLSSVYASFLYIHENQASRLSHGKRLAPPF